jgi:oligopeptide transport system ATP-binding protein
MSDSPVPANPAPPPQPAAAGGAPILSVRDLAIRFRTADGTVTAAADVGFDIRAGEIVGLVGESGSGKSQILMSLMGLLASNGHASGSAVFRGEENLNAPARRLDALRGASMSMIFQDPMTSLNPYLRVSTQLVEVLERHRGMTRAEAMAQALAIMESVRIPDAARRIRLYPHEFSGGMRQRVMIAMALLCRPALLLADEPTTALDVTVQAQILELIADLARSIGTAVLFVTHDLGVVARLCDRVIVLYGGRIMESGEATDIFGDPKHPYTRGLIDSTPRLDERSHGELRTIPGQPRAAQLAPMGCPFEPRCPRRVARCRTEQPATQETGLRQLACHEVRL